jgi:transposase
MVARRAAVRQRFANPSRSDMLSWQNNYQPPYGPELNPSERGWRLYYNRSPVTLTWWRRSMHYPQAKSHQASSGRGVTVYGHNPRKPT